MNQDRLVCSLLRQPVDRTPVWIMRQAGRYLPEYRAIRQKAGSFINLYKNTEWATEVTLQPLLRYPQLDAAILFSDILTIPEAMGLGLSFSEKEGPVFSHPIDNVLDIQSLPSIDVRKSLPYVFQTIEQVQQRLDGEKPLIGFSGSPWTLATYMVEGKGKSNFNKIKTLLYRHPKHLHALLDKLCGVIIEYLNLQIASGVQVVQIFDSWGGVLSFQAFHDFSLFYMDKILKNLTKTHNGNVIPTIIFTKGGGQWLGALSETGADCLGLDWMVNMGEARKQVGHRVALQGNLEPCVLLTHDRTCIEEEVKQVLRQAQSVGENTGHVFNLGHGILEKTDPESLKYLLETVVKYG